MEKAECRKLFWSFLKIGLFTIGGGYAMLPLIEKEVIDNRGWVERSDFLELLTLAQSAPGPISLNTSVFVGYKVRGLRGALSALGGVILPSFFIILVVAIFFTQIRDNHVVDAAFKGMRPAVVALIAAPVINMVRGTGKLNIALALTAAVAIWLLGLSPIYCIIAGAAAGIGYMLWENRKKSVK